MTDRSRYGNKAINKHKVLQIWSNLLKDQKNLPNN